MRPSIPARIFCSASASARRTPPRTRHQGDRLADRLYVALPGYGFANAIWNFGPILNAAVADAKAGQPTGKDYTPFSMMKEGGNDIAYVKGVAPAEAEAKMEARRAEIKSGAFTLKLNADEPK